MVRHTRSFLYTPLYTYIHKYSHIHMHMQVAICTSESGCNISSGTPKKKVSYILLCIHTYINTYTYTYICRWQFVLQNQDVTFGQAHQQFLLYSDGTIRLQNDRTMCLSIGTGMHVCMCVCMYMCVFVCVCVCVLVFIHSDGTKRLQNVPEHRRRYVCMYMCLCVCA